MEARKKISDSHKGKKMSETSRLALLKANPTNTANISAIIDNTVCIHVADHSLFVLFAFMLFVFVKL